jgi:hypothetical protein
MSLASIVVYAFNPILLQPAKSFLMWSQFGMLLGIALHLGNKQHGNQQHGNQHAEEDNTQSPAINASNTNPATEDDNNLIEPSR